MADEFWEYPPMREALLTRHMGQVIRAFRENPLLGRRAISQTAVAEWMGITQAQVSRIETGPPLVDLDRLTELALLLRIPEEYLWFSLPVRDGAVKRSHFLRLGGFLVTAASASTAFPSVRNAKITERDCAQWLAWELWQRQEEALHVTELPLSIARYLGLVNADGQLIRFLNTISPGGNILCDNEGYCTLAHPSLIDLLYCPIARQWVRCYSLCLAGCSTNGIFL